MWIEIVYKVKLYLLNIMLIMNAIIRNKQIVELSLVEMFNISNFSRYKLKMMRRFINWLLIRICILIGI